MAANEKSQPIVIKRIKKTAGGHGGAWKIAYADFVTALMAFFLLMWLLGSTTKATLQGIAQWFKNPEQVSLMGGPGSGSSNSVLNGGGSNINKTVGEVQRGQKKQSMPTNEAPADRSQTVDQRNLRELKNKLMAQIKSNPELAAFRHQLLISITPEGLRIQVVDSSKRPMFANGSTVLEPYARTIFSAIAPTLDELPNRISITGHTDALRYLNEGRGYSNFNLSAGRANSVRQILVQSGLAENKVLRVVGMGSAVLFVPKDPDSPLNRRVSIVVLSRAAEQRIIRDQQVEDSVENASSAQSLIHGAPK
ncbi:MULTISPECIES: flagellar motor protein MotB [Acidithiobacillus]|jgi:chemotaxis protein MotB|uniref:Flagellar motor rotation protein MotB n=3 Tax=Acidithiobacillus caldus TaxID=33059 RepID=F9ZNG2_ACICS|nr:MULTISPECIES: flagellar motor protein MotB [Acidithiobacillus]AEK58205.1 Flagellar motor rotation protein MotB [Acidithiobacillus caldus SM-1]AIA55191.1 Flagellar motor rotation protein MotB [Acidithiobacillus caldus ATCC 51756]AUW32837.1 flagellar motor protein MotB [Acidithiobacillus caldus]MBU2730011.1 flagellar motor protein MotB [Acidithiobacillus caldus]MBU2736530.1 flagellar motor protein MotB [Acidithiobacillus caldus ATCC 51756]